MTSNRLLPLAVLALVCSAQADTIHKTDGTSLEDVEIKKEGLTEVTYEASGKKDRTLPSDEVLKVEFEKLPQAIDRALEAIREDQLLAAVSDLQLYLAGIDEGGKTERREWAPPYARHLLLQQFRTMGEAQEALKYASELIERHPDSRYVPEAYLARAEILFEQGEAGKARSSVEAFAEVVDAQGLSQRWQLECDLALVLYDPSLKGEERRERLVIVSSNAGSQYPTVRNRAEVAQAESLLTDKKFDEAETIFERIAKSTSSDPSTRAAAFCGLGDCLFTKAGTLSKGSEEHRGMLKSALMAYLRVAINYKDQARYVARSLFFAARSFDLMGEEQADNAQKLYIRVLRNFPDSQWASESRGFIRR